MSHGKISKQDIFDVQKQWGNAVVNIGHDYISRKDYVATASSAIETLYDFDNGSVLFKPTRTMADNPFRNTKESAIAYFVGGGEYDDAGFAINPWSRVRFDENQTILIKDDFAISMGLYYFMDANTNIETTVEFTFGYRFRDDGNLVIFLHHSSIPYSK